MASMYDTILSLPFFHGLDQDAVSQFVEKVPVRFGHYSDGELLYIKDDECQGLTFILSGRLHLKMSKSDDRFSISYQLSEKSVIGADFLYGIERCYPYDVTAVGVVDTLHIDKSDFAWLLRSNEICVINYFNYLSRRSQRSAECFRLIGEASLQRYLAQWLTQFADTKAENICIEASQRTLAEVTGLSFEQVRQSETDLELNGATRRTDRGLEILDPRRIL